MRGKPDVLYVVDQLKEDIAIKEAKAIGIKVVVIIDTNSNPDGIDYPIPGNDDSIRSVKLITTTIADTIIEGYEGQIPQVHKMVQSKNGVIGKLTTNIKQETRSIQEITIPLEQEV